jgi:hypothetical protein
MNHLVPGRLRELWQHVNRREMTAEAVQEEQERPLDIYRQTWAEALGSRDTQILRLRIGQH